MEMTEIKERIAKLEDDRKVVEDLYRKDVITFEYLSKRFDEIIGERDELYHELEERQKNESSKRNSNRK